MTLEELFNSLTEPEKKLIDGIIPPTHTISELLALNEDELKWKLENSLPEEDLDALSDIELLYRGGLKDRVIAAWSSDKKKKENNKNHVTANTKSDDSEDSDNNLGNKDVNGNNNANDVEKEDEEEEDDGESPAEKLLRLVDESDITLFKDQYKIAYALTPIGDHRETFNIESKGLERFLVKKYYDETGKVIGSESVKNVIKILQAKAEYEGETYPLSLRTAWHNGNIYCDMTNDEWQVVKITPEGWTLEGKTPIPMFARYKQTSQAQPKRDYDGDIFDRFLQLTNLKEEEDRILLSVYIISLFIPDIHHVISQIHGEKGSAKSMLQTLIKELVDPTKPKLLTIYNDQKEFIQQLAHNYIAFYDNLKYTPRWLSDEACKACTGVGSTKRKLFSDDEDVVYEYRSCLGFNGINLGLTEPDLLDRSIMVELQRIKRENARQESEIMEQFYQLRPQLLGYIFDTLVKALQIKPTIKLNDLPRMGDFAIWGEAIARAMGYRDLGFISVYYDNIGRQNIEAIENSPLGQTISKFVRVRVEGSAATGVEERPCSWQGSMSQALDHLNTIAAENNIDTSRNWPKAPNSLSRKLKPILSNLREGLDINVVMYRNSIGSAKDGKGKGTHMLRVYRISILPSPSSPSSLDKFHEGNLEEKSDGISEGDNTCRHQGIISSPKHIQNHVQNPIGDGSDNSDDILGNNGVPSSSSQIQAEACLEPEPSPNLDHNFRCYHKSCSFTTNSDQEYRRHGAQYHSKNPLLYPTKHEIEINGLNPQGKSWEV